MMRELTQDRSDFLFPSPRRGGRQVRSVAQKAASASSSGSGKSPAANQGRSDSASNASTTSQKPRILVVDDNAINRRVLAGMVRALGCDVETADNGADAIECLRRGQAFHLIFMDCEMPVL